MHAPHVTTSIESFDDNRLAEAAIRELISVGFTQSQIGVISPRLTPKPTHPFAEVDPPEKNLGVDEFGSLKVFSGVVPGFGLALAGGRLGEFFWNLGGFGTARALSAVGVPVDHAQQFETDFESGRTIITVNSGTRADIAQSVLNRFKDALSYSV